ncbi:nicotinamidase-related amidase [Humitalea rosea]|uniref:Nicotinamidase-related amidase n=1 Tax=Humitalea rosea TaxID=990373 RepID=A0A2W7IVX8_9PROT|nr:isochorismatase family cysteine hydrolase [Humitalea rosea]PZW50918.1 nicotinamidase-related amidase [Humitalea rosea]
MQHQLSIPDSVIQRVVARCGTPHPFAMLDPVRTALLVIDMQNGYMRADVSHSCVPTAPGIVPAINRLAASLRGAGGAVFWVQNATDERSREEWSVLEEQASPARRAARIRSVSPGTKGHEFWPDLDIREEDTIVAKFRYSAFIAGASDIEARLRARGLDTVLIAGTLTNVCCESSARDAMMLNFRTIMVSDANAAMTDAEHNASLINFYLSFGDVLTVAEVEAGLTSIAQRDVA